MGVLACGLLLRIRTLVFISAFEGSSLLVHSIVRQGFEDDGEAVTAVRGRMPTVEADVRLLDPPTRRQVDKQAESRCICHGAA